MSKLMPVRIKRAMETQPEPQTMAFCGVEIGSIKPKDAPKVAGIAGMTGSTPAAMASGATIGTVTAAAVVLRVVSEMRDLTPVR